MKVALICFSLTGQQTGERLCRGLEAAGMTAELDKKSKYLLDSIQISTSAWAGEKFSDSDALIFIGATGIAVRSIAPYVASKKSDPAVLVVDECGKFVISLLSGHLGGANDLARAIAAVCGAVPVITTATDAHGIFAVDEWAKHQNCMVLEPERIKLVSGKLLAGQPVYYRADFPVMGTVPAGLFLADTPEKADFALTLCPTGQALHLVPRIGVLGIGCKRGTSAETLEAAFAAFCTRYGFAARAVTAAASIDLKLAFCQAHGWPVRFYSAAQLRSVPGQFTPSPFVQSVTGVDNVCERAAVLDAGGSLFYPKFACSGVTLALACRPFAPDWRSQNA